MATVLKSLSQNRPCLVKKKKENSKLITQHFVPVYKTFEKALTKSETKIMAKLQSSGAENKTGHEKILSIPPNFIETSN